MTFEEVENLCQPFLDVPSINWGEWVRLTTAPSCVRLGRVGAAQPYRGRWNLTGVERFERPTVERPFVFAELLFHRPYFFFMRRRQ